ncbi:hypothetical protein [Halobacillus litoralis]|nr:hypothetical protein [Halobacillus litoralis]
MTWTSFNKTILEKNHTLVKICSSFDTMRNEDIEKALVSDGLPPFKK